MRRRHVLTTAVSAVATVGLVGCLDGTADEAEPTGSAPKPDSATADSETAAATADQTAAETTVHAVDAPDPDHAIWVENESDTTHRLSATVTRHVDDGPDEVVHESTHELQPKGSEYVYNLREANPDGVERFEVTGETADQTASRFVASSECYLDCGIVLRERGELVVERPIC